GCGGRLREAGARRDEHLGGRRRAASARSRLVRRVGGGRVSDWQYALYLAAALLVGLVAREYARALVTVRLGDPTPRLWGRLALDPHRLGRRRRDLVLVSLAGPAANLVIGAIAGTILRAGLVGSSIDLFFL